LSICLLVDVDEEKKGVDGWILYFSSTRTYTLTTAVAAVVGDGKRKNEREREEKRNAREKEKKTGRQNRRSSHVIVVYSVRPLLTIYIYICVYACRCRKGSCEYTHCVHDSPWHHCERTGEQTHTGSACLACAVTINKKKKANRQNRKKRKKRSKQNKTNGWM